MAIFDDDNNVSDNGSEFSSYSDSYDESDDEPDDKWEQVSTPNDWLRVANTSMSYKGKNVTRVDESDDEEVGLRSPVSSIILFVESMTIRKIIRTFIYFFNLFYL
jgi:hypothetical protein